MKCEAINTTDDHIKYVSEKMRVKDKNEVYISDGVKPYNALYDSVKLSNECYTITYKKIPIAIFGRSVDKNNNAAVWLLGTDDIELYQKSFYQITRQFVINFLQKNPVLYNYVYVGNNESIRWLKKLGADFKKPQPYGKFNSDFMYFELRGD